MGLENFTKCIRYQGADIPEFGIICGDDLETVILKLSGNPGGKLTSMVNDVSVLVNTLTTDKIASLAETSYAGASPCALAIKKRDFTYTLITSQTGATFTYDVTDAINALPSGYTHAATSVKAYGALYSGSTAVATTKSQSAGFDIKVNRFPITVDIVSRIKTPCGDIDLSKTISIPSPSQSGTFRKDFDVRDLVGGSQGEMNLTKHLNQIEDQLRYLRNRVDSLFGIEVDGTTYDIRSLVEILNSKVNST